MAPKKCKGTRLEVFSDKAAPLNRLIFEIFRAKKLASYDTYLEVRRVREFRHKKYQTVDRRMKALYEQGWLILDGTKTTQPGTEAPLYRLSSKGYTAIELDRISMDTFLLEADEKLLLEMVKLLASFQESASKAKDLKRQNKVKHK